MFYPDELELFLIYPDLPWLTLIHLDIHDLLKFTLIYFDLPKFTWIYPYLTWNTPLELTLIYLYLHWFIWIYPHLTWFNPMYLNLPWFTQGKYCQSVNCQHFWNSKSLKFMFTFKFVCIEKKGSIGLTGLEYLSHICLWQASSKQVCSLPARFEIGTSILLQNLVEFPL